MAMDISVDIISKCPDAIGLTLTPEHARFLARRLEEGAKSFEKKGDEKFQVAFVSSFISCTQRVCEEHLSEYSFPNPHKFALRPLS